MELPYTILKGATITAIRYMDEDGYEVKTNNPRAIYRATPVLSVTTALGERLSVLVWRDPEGNGPGYLAIGPE